jgi:protein TonB
VKALALSALAAVLVHALLFSLNPSWTRPPQVRKAPSAVTVTLAPKPAPAPRQPAVGPLHAPRPARIAPLRPKAAQKILTPKPAQPKPARAPRPKVQPPPVVAATSTPPSPADATQSATAPAAEDSSTPSPPAPPQAGRAAAADAAQAPVQTSVPRYDLNPRPDYPALARRRGYQGTVLLKVLVNAGGRAAQVTLARSSGFDILDRGAVKSVSGWRFEPARRNGQPIDMWVEVPVRYALE